MPTIGKRSDGGGGRRHSEIPLDEVAQQKGSMVQITKLGQRSGSVVSRRPAATGAGTKIETETETAARQSLSRAQSGAPQYQIEDIPIGSTEELKLSIDTVSNSDNRLVFGLNPRANKVKHDEYAERRAKQLASQRDSPPETTTKTSVALSTTDQKTQTNDKAQSVSTSTIRASKYGNFYRPPDFQATVSTANNSSPVISGPNEPKKVLVRQRSESPERRRVTTTVVVDEQTGSQTGANEREVRGARREDKYKKQAIDTSTEMATENPRATKKVPDPSPSAADKQQQVDQSSKQPEVVTAPRMQFNIPPPPKQNTGSMTRNSVISYAKSRIYDKQQTKQPVGLNNGTNSGVLHDNCNNIPQSILSGFKPPKQVNVSKARERWEGGEPFAKCKSRQRLAQSANKKILYGTWSMTSVVATQQMQLQQALAQSSSFASSSQFNSNDSPPMKILIRGSVLERVQQYEQAPANLRTSASAGSLSSSTGSLSSSSSSSSSSLSSASSTISSADSGSTLRQPNLSANNNISQSPTSRTEVSTAATNQTQPLQVIKSAPTDQITANLKHRFSLRRRSSTSSAIPKFYHPNGKPNTYEIELQKKNIVACFDKFTDRKALLTAPAYKRHFHAIAIACGFSEYFKEPLYRYVKHQMVNSNLLHSTGPANLAYRKQSAAFGPLDSVSNGLSTIKTFGNLQHRTGVSPLTRAASIDNSTVEKLQNQNFISCEQYLTCWRHLISSCFDNPARFVHLLSLGQRNYLLPEDFVPLIQSVIDDHPGLKFLRSAPDFHMRYIQTVIARIYFCINRSWTGKLSLSELRRSNLLEVLELLAREEDINQVTEYFSYEHFYVIYCKFWSLDQDHDLLISKEDLARHNDAAISSRIIDRIFTGVVSKRIQETCKMSYSDFVWFLIADEDKKHPRSVEYWFRLMDIDGDGYISMYEMEYFYYELMKRLEMMNIEALPFLDCACQLLDLINPKEKNKISLSDLKKTKLASIFFDTFINLEKYLEHESREFVSSRDIVQNGQVISDWDRYASEAYESLVAEESSV